MASKKPTKKEETKEDESMEAPASTTTTTTTTTPTAATSEAKKGGKRGRKPKKDAPPSPRKKVSEMTEEEIKELAKRREQRKIAEKKARSRELDLLKNLPNSFTPAKIVKGAERPQRPKLETRRFSFSNAKIASKPIVVPSGKGEKLKNLEYVAKEIGERSGRDTTLTVLHRILFNRNPLSGTLCKKNLLKFNGVVYDDEHPLERFESKFGDLRLPLLRDMCRVFNIDESGEREDFVKRLIKFIRKPHDSGRIPPTKEERKEAKEKAKAEKAEKGEESPKKKKKKASKKRKSKSAKESKIKNPRSSFIFFSNKKRDEMKEKHPKDSSTKIFKRLGEKWRKMSKSEKEEYERMAAEDKKRWKRERKEEEEKLAKKKEKEESSSDSEEEKPASPSKKKRKC